ncbi:unnamed protein product [Spirodela intermedia]|uniref:Receptor-like serine/threonine-protein kinase n=1 Tax=Spirodela intermedia TaxID=51605 RepID=A0A7I8KA38_SPIIN|nr:unnamed protein product [Spirodela intermedia]
MVPISLSLFLIFLSSILLRPLDGAGDRLRAGESSGLNQTIVSAGRIFALGFFSPGNSSGDWYAGIWYNNLPTKTVVWVANREAPLRDPGGAAIGVTREGNLAVRDGRGRSLWSTNLTRDPDNSTAAAVAVLLDSGNLVLRRWDTASDPPLWQSFDHPTHTLLPGMKLRLNFTSGEATRLRSWSGAADPSAGDFVFTLEGRWGLEPYVFKGEEIHWRGPMWLGIPLFPLQLGDVNSRYLQSVYATDQEIYYNYSMIDSSLLVRYVLDHSGTYSFRVWDDGAAAWNSIGTTPTRPCDFFNLCGGAASCDSSGQSPLCRCLNGFDPSAPEEWAKGNFTGGCVRRRRLLCDGTDRYTKIGGLKLPDRYSVAWNLSLSQCEASCSTACNCSAFSHTNFSTFNLTGSRCLTWFGDMVDLVQIPLLSQDLYVRLSAAQLDGDPPADDSPSGKNQVAIRIALPIAVSTGVLLMGACCYCAARKLKSRGKSGGGNLLRLEEIRLTDALGSEKGVPMVDLESVRAATANFSISNQLGEGGFGAVYKGKLKSGEAVAVKRLSRASKQGCEEFANEVLLIAKLQHRNLVRLLGWCSHGDERILIYEFMPNKSLDHIIFDSTRSAELSWERRFGIIRGVADGLLYLHQHSRMRVIHRDLKTNNILLDGEMNPKISDFGLARIFEMNQMEANTARVVGTYGYMSPEYAMDGVFSEKSDVFSFGVIVLEIVTGKRSTGFYRYKNSLNLLGYAWQMWEEGRVLELLDPTVDSRFEAGDVVKCIHLGLLCIQEYAADRPTMAAVVSCLAGEGGCGSLAAPKQPAFAIGRESNPLLPLSIHRSEGRS